MEKRKQRTLAIFALAIALVATTVAYAVLQTTLTISGSVTKKGGSWNVHLDNVTNEQVGGSATFTTQPTISGTTLNFSAQLVKPNDWFSFDVDLVNSGTIAAYLDTWTFAFTFGNKHVESYGEMSTTSDDVTCSLLYNGKIVNANSIVLNLQPSNTKKVTVKCKYDDVSSISSADKALDMRIHFSYSQNAR